MEERGRTWLVISRMDTTPTRKLPNARRRITFVRYRKMSFSLLQEVGTQAQPRRGQGGSGAPARLSRWGRDVSVGARIAIEVVMARDAGRLAEIVT